MSIQVKNPLPGGSEDTLDRAGSNVHPLHALSREEFAELGGAKTVFVRSISAGQLAKFLPEAKNMPKDVVFQLIMGADGAPIMVSDNPTLLADWLMQNDVKQIMRH